MGSKAMRRIAKELAACHANPVPSLSVEAVSDDDLKHWQGKHAHIQPASDRETVG
ncbi:hypothetical protein THASP1DRAFT_33451 [Thamnocephalis sphaerospora]|uniref:Uncharacterized protein n=1 Tax=Thamnocephalis sphaerospora TaxID=78915 RepID=A0A4P9XGH9_9FUNG|nr:hypothetical protein THASP1DRAFT_33451 [Thamnocephalis sphaerospora]|eukprot:RKP04743.1 hypothetical protein THASP1DRAFT_33451 [Thamnocephalis sphaerospora]